MAKKTGPEIFAIEDKIQRAREIGARDRANGVRLDMSDADSASLMTELGETGPTTEDNHPGRWQMCEAYEEGWDFAGPS